MNAKLTSRTVLEWTTLLMEAGIPAGPIYDLQQLFEDPNLAASGLVEMVTHPQLGEIKQLSNPLRLDSIGPATVRTPPPRLGEHTLSILSQMGLDKLMINNLVAAKVVADDRETE